MNQLSIKKMNQITKKKKKGFTLIELIIVIAIIAILAAMAIPKFGQIRENANQKADIATAKNIATIVAELVADNNSDIDADGSAHAINATIIARLDGDSTPKALAANNAASFDYTVDATTGDITISYTGGDEVYPDYDAAS